MSEKAFDEKLNIFKEIPLAQRKRISSIYGDNVEAHAQSQLEDYIQRAEDQDEDFTQSAPSA
jgi:hypothetical protein